MDRTGWTRVWAIVIVGVAGMASLASGQQYRLTLDRHEYSFTQVTQCPGRAQNSGGPTTTSASVLPVPEVGCPLQGFTGGLFRLEFPANPTIEATGFSGNSATLKTGLAIGATLSGQATLRPDTANPSRSREPLTTDLKVTLPGTQAAAPPPVTCPTVTASSVIGTVGGTGAISARAACEVKSLTLTAPAVVVGGQVTAFTAVIGYSAQVTQRHNAGLNTPDWRGGIYDLSVKTYYKYELQEDLLQISNPAPTAGERLDPGSIWTFRARATYTLRSENTANLELRLYDKRGSVVATSTTRRVSRGSGTADLEITNTAPRTAQQLSMRAFLIGPSRNVLKQSAPVDYPVTTELTIHHVEVAQVVQDENNSIPLIEDKQTFVRVFTLAKDLTAEALEGAAVTVRAYRDAVELVESPLRIFDPFYLSPRQYDRGISGRKSHNVYLPARWTRQGKLRLVAEVNPDGADRIGEKDYQDNVKSVDLTFGFSPALTVRYLPVCVELAGEEKRCPSAAIGGFSSLAQDIYPISDKLLSYEPLQVPDYTYRSSLASGWAQSRFFSAMRAFLLLHEVPGSTDGFDQLALWLPNGYTSDLAGKADALWVDGSGRITLNVDGGSGEFNQKILAHEIGHNLGLHHPATSDSCGSADPDTDWPFTTAQTGELGYRPSQDRIMGKSWHDVMSYCNTPGVWISPFHYLKLVQGGFRPRSSILPAGGKPANERRLAEPADFLILSGSARADGTAGQFESIYRLRSAVAGDAPKADGNHCIRFKGADGPVGEHCFDLTFRDPETQEPLEEEAYTLKVAFPPGVTGIALMRGDAEIAARAVSPNAPSVRFVSPAPEETWEEGQRTLTWEGSDADGDSLIYSLLYSADGGQNWLPLQQDLKETQYLLDPARIRGGSSVFFRVLASDGLNTTASDVGPVTIVQRPRLELPQGPVDLYNALAGSAVQRTVILRNSGSGPLTVGSVEGETAAITAVIRTPFTIPSGGARSLPIRFAPPSKGPYSVRLRLNSSDAERPTQELTVEGVAVDTYAPEIVAGPATLDFGMVQINGSQDLTVRILNRGPAPLEVRSIRSDAAAAAVIGLEAPFTLDGGAERSVTVRYQPSGAGTLTGALSIASNDPRRPTVTVTLRGSAIAP